MKYVEIYKLQNDGSQKILAICRLVDDVVVCEGDEIFVQSLTEDGIFDHESKPPRRKLTFADGIKFLEQLRHNFTNGYLNASDVKND